MNGQGEPANCDYVIRAHQLCMDLLNIMVLINSSHDVEQILHEIAEESCKALGCESARIAMREGNNWIIRYVNKLPDDLIGRSFTDQDLPHAALAMATKKPVAIDDAFHDDRVNTGMMKSLGIRSVLVLPLMEKEVVVGTLSFGYHSTMAAFTDTEIEYADRVATGVAIALQNARLYQGLQQTETELEESNRLGNALNEIDTILYSTQDYDAIMKSMLRLATDAIGAETSMIFSKEGDRWMTRYVYKLPESLIGRSFSNTEVLHTAITAGTKRSIVVSDALHSQDVDQKFIRMLGIRSLLDFPLIVKGEVIGDLTFHYHSSPVPFNERQAEFVRKLQNSISLALENARLLDVAKQSESRLKEAEKIGKFGYFHYDVRTRKMTWSEGMFHIFGRDKDLGEPTVEEFFELYSLDPGMEEMREIVRKEQPVQFDAKVKRDDNVLYVDITIQSLKDDDGNALTRFGTIQDITERKQSEEALQEVNRELEAFNYTVAHDLRKPLTVINGYCQILMEACGEKLDGQCNAYLKEAYEGTLNMNRLIDALLNFSRVGHAEPKREPVNLCGMCLEVAAELKLAEPERHVTFRIPSGIVAEADPDLLRVVLGNLFGNAWKYTTSCDEAIIEFGAKEIRGKRIYFVKDNGIGFDQAKAGKLFTPFQRLETGKDVGGLGIGLATVARIIQRHGGEVWAEGEQEKGATFFFTLGER